MTVPLTVVIPTLNEAAQIADCVRGVSWAQEIIVADAGSGDGTAERARAAGATVLTGSWTTIAAQRNAAVAAARHDWILAVDADERVSSELVRAVTAAVAGAADRHEAYAARRRNVYLGRTIRFGGWGSDWVVRLFPRDRRFVERRVHEHLERQADVGRLSGYLEHVPYRDLSHHLAKLDRYATWAARDLADRGRRARLTDLLVRPPVRFLRMYVFQLGILDGWHGAVLCVMAAASVFLKYARLWELQRADA